MISQLPQIAHNPVAAVQLAGHMPLPTPASESRELVRSVASNYFGETYYFNTPLYIQDPKLKDRLMKEPDIAKTLAIAKNMSIVISGIGGNSSLPITNPIFRPYLTEKDLASVDSCMGSIYGYVIDKNGQIADIDLNHKVSAVPAADILAVPHRIAVVYGRHKAAITANVIRHQYVNELVTDTETAVTLLELDN